MAYELWRSCVKSLTPESAENKGRCSNYYWMSKSIIGVLRSQKQGSVGRFTTSQEVEIMLWCWMQENKYTKWFVACYFVQKWYK